MHHGGLMTNIQRIDTRYDQTSIRAQLRAGREHLLTDTLVWSPYFIGGVEVFSALQSIRYEALSPSTVRTSLREISSSISTRAENVAITLGLGNRFYYTIRDVGAGEIRLLADGAVLGGASIDTTSARFRHQRFDFMLRAGVSYRLRNDVETQLFVSAANVGSRLVPEVLTPPRFYFSDTPNLPPTVDEYDRATVLNYGLRVSAPF